MSEERDTVEDTLKSGDVVIPENTTTVGELKEFIRKTREEEREKTRQLLAAGIKNIQEVNESQE